MKKNYIVACLIFFSIGNIRAQDINITLQGGYVFDDSFDSYFDFGEYYEGKIKGGFQWGAGAEYMLTPDYGIELSYLRQDTNSPTTYFRRTDNSVQYTNFDLGINYIMFGGNRYLSLADASVDGFLGIMGGMVIATAQNPETGREGDATKFAWGAKVGGIYWFSTTLGLKLQTQIISSVQTMGGGLYFGTGGAGAGLNSYSTIYQFGFAGALVFKIDR